MGILAFTDGHVTINGVEHSTRVKGVALDYGATMLDASAMGVDTEVNLAGVKKWSVEVTFNQDYADDNVDEKMFALVGAAAFTIALRPDNAAISADNPEYAGSAVLESYEPIKGAFGELLGAKAVFRSAGALTRDITP